MVVLVAVISGGVLTVQSCLLKEIFGNNYITVRREGKDPYFLLILFKRFEMLAAVSRIYLGLYISFLICGSGEHL